MIKGVIFDLDGVLVTTDDLHFLAWKQLGESIGVTNFTEEDNKRQRGVSRMASLEVLLEKCNKQYSKDEKINLAEEKNSIYVKSLEKLDETDVLDGVIEFLSYLKINGIKTAVGSASKNAPLILEKTGLLNKIDEIACGLDTTKSKPDPEVFLIAAKKLGLSPDECLVVEDADAGVEAAKRGGIKVLAVGAAKNNPNADYSSDSIADFDYNIIK